MYGFAGQPGKFTTGLSVTTLFVPTAPVGLGSADGMPPQLAHEPIEITAAASAAALRVVSIAVLPATRQ